MEELSKLVIAGKRLIAHLITGEKIVVASGLRSTGNSPYAGSDGKEANERFARNMIKLDMSEVEKLVVYKLTKTESGGTTWTKEIEIDMEG